MKTNIENSLIQLSKVAGNELRQGKEIPRVMHKFIQQQIKAILNSRGSVEGHFWDPLTNEEIKIVKKDQEKPEDLMKKKNLTEEEIMRGLNE